MQWRKANRGKRGFLAPPPPRVFFAKSAESLEKKRVEFLVSAKKCKKVQKSAHVFEKKGDSG
jgi:hypothetical protein